MDPEFAGSAEGEAVAEAEAWALSELLPKTSSVVGDGDVILDLLLGEGEIFEVDNGFGRIVGVRVGDLEAIGVGVGVGLGEDLGVGLGLEQGDVEAELLLASRVLLANRTILLPPSGDLPILCDPETSHTPPASPYLISSIKVSPPFSILYNLTLSPSPFR